MLRADAKLGIGPPITDGFYYDFDVASPFTPDDLRELEKQMTKIIKGRQRFRRRPVSDEQARAELASEPYKLELIADRASAGAEANVQADGSGDAAGVEVSAGELTIYDNLRRDDSVAWKDLCRGPHLPNTGYIPAFALTRNSAAYWRGDQHKAQLQRLYGTAWPSREALKAHQTRLKKPPSATTASSAPSSICFPSRTRSVPAWRSSTRRVGCCARSWRITRGSATPKPATSS